MRGRGGSLGGETTFCRPVGTPLKARRRFGDGKHKHGRMDAYVRLHASTYGRLHASTPPPLAPLVTFKRDEMHALAGPTCNRFVDGQRA